MALKILHTADFHLKDYEDERWLALKKVCEIGKKEEIDLFLIAGDLFDKGVDAERLRPKIRELFSSFNFLFIILPGNHDMDCFKKGFDFGDNVKIISEGESLYERKEIRILGLPFRFTEEKEVLRALYNLNEKIDSNKKNILLYHGELLDLFFSNSDRESLYMPARLSYFKDLKIDYVLAGHFHSKFEVRKISNEKYFVYCGSPISITQKEKGQRKVNIFKVGEPPREYLIDTPYFEEKKIDISPLKHKNPVKEVKRAIEGLPPQAKLILTLSGFLDKKRIPFSERGLKEEIREILPPSCQFNFEVRDITEILESDLFKEFSSKLAQRDLPSEKKEEVFRLVVEAMAQTFYQ